MDRIRLGTVTITDRERKYVNEVLESSYVSPGKFTKAFETEVAQAHGKLYGLAVNSGQSAIMVVLEAAAKMYNITNVAVPAITYISSVSAIIQAGLKPVIVDVTRDCNAELMWERIPDVCNAVLPCHLFGRANIPPQTIKNTFVCEDACESIYAQGLGFGDAICLSFYPSHTITAGFGGMILTDNKELYFKCWQLVNHGRKDWDDYTTCHNLKERFTFDEIGYSLKFSDLNAALGLAQHENREWILQQRAKNAWYLTQVLSTIDDLVFPDFDNHTFMMLPIIVPSGRRNDLENALNNANIETRRMMPITTQPIIQKLFGHDVIDKYPNAKYINEHGLYIGCHQGIGQEHLNRIVDTIWDFYKSK
jgi:dTDP-4-amino-4,6-dideoxygalactose transaminase